MRIIQVNKFNIGQKVVCINDTMPEQTSDIFPNWIVKYEEYTIRECKWNSLTNCYQVLLDEISNPPYYFNAIFGKTEPGFNSNRFASIDSEELYEEAYTYEKLAA